MAEENDVQAPGSDSNNIQHYPLTITAEEKAENESEKGIGDEAEKNVSKHDISGRKINNMAEQNLMELRTTDIPKGGRDASIQHSETITEYKKEDTTENSSQNSTGDKEEKIVSEIDANVAKVDSMAEEVQLRVKSDEDSLDAMIQSLNAFQRDSMLKLEALTVQDIQTARVDTSHIQHRPAILTEDKTDEKTEKDTGNNGEEIVGKNDAGDKKKECPSEYATNDKRGVTATEDASRKHEEDQIKSEERPAEREEKNEENDPAKFQLLLEQMMQDIESLGVSDGKTAQSLPAPLVATCDTDSAPETVPDITGPTALPPMINSDINTLNKELANLLTLVGETVGPKVWEGSSASIHITPGTPPSTPAHNSPPQDPPPNSAETPEAKPKMRRVHDLPPPKPLRAKVANSNGNLNVLPSLLSKSMEDLNHPDKSEARMRADTVSTNEAPHHSQRRSMIAVDGVKNFFLSAFKKKNKRPYSVIGNTQSLKHVSGDSAKHHEETKQAVLEK